MNGNGNNGNGNNYNSEMTSGEQVMNSKNSRKNNMSRKNSRKNNRKNNMVTRKQRGGKRGSIVGSRVQVMHGTCHHTAGGLTKGDLMMHKGRIVSRKAHAAGKKAIRRLRAAGYVAKKGHFTLFKKKGSRKH